MLTKAELAEIKARADAATEGPWCWSGSSDKDNGYIVGRAYDEHNRYLTENVDNEEFFGETVIGSYEAATVNYGDATFIAHARTDIPAILAHIEELEANAKQVRDEALEEAAGVCEWRCESCAINIRALKEQNNG